MWARCSALLRASPPLTRRRTLSALPSSYTRAGADDVAFFRGVCGAEHVLTPSDAGADLSKYNVDWMRQYRGSTAAVVKPRDTAGVSAILAHCSARRIPVVPQGGNTGLVGGGVPLSHEVVLSLERLRDVHSFDEDSGVVVCGGGLVLQALDEALGARGWMVPLDLGSKGSCAVGGNVATNAGGLRLLRYGSLHGSVLGVEAVTGNGTVLDALCTLRKDNVGFDVKQLFIGSEGALGVVTKVAMQAVQRPAALNVAVLGAASFADCRSLLRLARRRLGEVLSAAEFVDGAAMRILLAQLAGTRLPFSAPAPFFFFVELSGSNEAHDAEKLAGFLEEATAEGLALDGTVAADGAQTRSIWRLREDVSVACSQRGHVYKCARAAGPPPPAHPPPSVAPARPHPHRRPPPPPPPQTTCPCRPPACTRSWRKRARASRAWAGTPRAWCPWATGTWGTTTST
jgi:FAD/FMN-containing dehydrogenase